VTDEDPELSSELKAAIGDHLAQFFDDVADTAADLGAKRGEPGALSKPG
jgi:hypothetical protein